MGAAITSTNNLDEHALLLSFICPFRGSVIPHVRVYHDPRDECGKCANISKEGARP